MYNSFHRNQHQGKYHRSILRILTALVLAAALCLLPSAEVSATSSSELKQQRDQTQSALSSAQYQQSRLEGQQEALSDEMEQKSQEIAQNMASIQLAEEHIAELDEQIAQKQKEYDAAKAKEDQQYQEMTDRIRDIYEQGDYNYMQLLLKATSFTDMLNKVEYINALYDYDRNLLDNYRKTKEEADQAKNELEDEKSEQEEAKAGLESEQANLDAQMEELQEQYDNYDELIAQAQEEASSLAQQLKEQNAAVEAAMQQEYEQEQARLKAEAEAAASASESSDSASSDESSSEESSESDESSESASSEKTYAAPSGSTGEDVVAYACQFVGNPYVYGGTSLTNGTDCSGFTQSVYAAFGYSLPRTAEAQRSAGTAVDSLEDAQPGDLICYPGHVAIYCGNGTIVHASTARTGIKYSPVTYRDYVCIRRIIN